MDVKNVLVFALIILVIVGFIKDPSWYRLIVESRYERVAEAKITNMVAKNSSFQNYKGTDIKTVGCDITYAYEAGNKKYTNTEFIEPRQDTKRIIDPFNIEIKYSPKKHSESLISKLNLRN